MIVDTHAHLDFPHYDKDRDKVIKRSLDLGVKIINVGVNYETSKKAIELSKKEGVFAAVGLHPTNIDTDLVKNKENFSSLEKDFDSKKYEKLIKSSSKVVMLGEMGLDYWRRPKTNKKKEEFKKKQKEILSKQLELANDLELPVNIHCRSAHDDLIGILKKFDLKGIIHCFTGDKEKARKYLEMGFCLGINGIIFKLDLDDVVKETSIEKIVLETDCPYLTPPGVESKRNEPAFIKEVAQKVAEIKGLNLEEVEEKTTENVKKLLKI